MTPSKRRREGREAFEPNCDQTLINPWLNEKKEEWFASVYARDFEDGWKEAEMMVDAKRCAFCSNYRGCNFCANCGRKLE